MTSPDPLRPWFTAAGSRAASDLVFEPEADGTLTVRARIDGVRTVLGRIEAPQAAAMIARLKGLAGLPGYISGESQDGRIDGRPWQLAGDCRLAVLPTVNGDRCAVRLPAIGDLPVPQALGFTDDVRSALQALVRRPEGLVIIAGPTGSGKTTTLHSLIADLVATRPDRQVLTIEDPVERRLAGVTQVEIDAHRQFGFAEALAASLRHDPDVIVVGEIRDPATALACARASLTGHLVLTTVHAGRAAEVCPRLREMGVEDTLLLPALRAVLAQRLVRRRHGPCRGEGCAACAQGYAGRQVLADLLLVEEDNRERLRRRQAPVLTADLDQQAAALLRHGATTADEMARVLG